MLLLAGGDDPASPAGQRLAAIMAANQQVKPEPPQKMSRNKSAAHKQAEVLLAPACLLAWLQLAVIMPACRQCENKPHMSAASPRQFLCGQSTQSLHRLWAVMLRLWVGACS